MFNDPLEEKLVFAGILHELIARLDTIRLHFRLSHRMSSPIHGDCFRLLPLLALQWS